MGKLPEELPPISTDIGSISRAVARQRRFEAYVQRAAERNPRFKVADELLRDLDFLSSYASLPGFAARPGKRFRMLRILVRRFGALTARYLLLMAAEVSDTHFRIVLQERKDKERPDRGRSRRNFQRAVEDYELLLAVQRQERLYGLSGEAAIKAANKELNQVTRGVDGAKKALKRARRDARERGFADPMAAFLPMFLGLSVDEPPLKVADLRGPGRPKKGTNPAS
jgi:hypothetical protein